MQKFKFFQALSIFVFVAVTLNGVMVAPAIAKPESVLLLGEIEMFPSAANKTLKFKIKDPLFGTGKRDLNIKKFCGAPPDTEFVAIFSVFIKPIAKFFLGAVQAKLEAEVKKYVKSYSAERAVAFYTLEGGKVRSVNFKCFRFIRGEVVTTPGGVKTITPDLDFIGHIALVGYNNEAMQFQPLVIWFRKPLAKGQTISLAITVEATSVWHKDGEGKSEQAFTATLLKKKIKKKDGDWPKEAIYFDLDCPVIGSNSVRPPWAAPCDYPIVPLISWTVTENSGRSALTESANTRSVSNVSSSNPSGTPTNIPPGNVRFGGWANFKVSVAEVGESPRRKVLKAIKKLLSEADDDLTNALTEAIKGLSEDPEEDDGETDSDSS